MQHRQEDMTGRQKEDTTRTQRHDMFGGSRPRHVPLPRLLTLLTCSDATRLIEAPKAMPATSRYEDVNPNAPYPRVTVDTVADKRLCDDMFEDREPNTSVPVTVNAVDTRRRNEAHRGSQSDARYIPLRGCQPQHAPSP